MAQFWEKSYPPGVQLAHAPAIPQHITLTTIDMIKFWWSGFNIRYWRQTREANVKSKAPLGLILLVVLLFLTFAREGAEYACEC